ncbi:MAG: hypothetical protein ACI8P3_002149 [Saprospiraceae bacterium]|jgi:hypothetical protein
MLRSIVALIMVATLVACIYLPIDIPYSFNSVARVYPIQKWELLKNNDGSLISSLHNYRTGLLKDYSSFQFDRGDVVNIQFNPGQIAETFVDSGTMIASIYSNSLSEKLINLKNQLNVERANLQKEKAGEKVEIVLEAEENLRMTKDNVIYYERSFNRAKRLLAEGLIAKATFEQIESDYQEAQNAVAIAQKQINIQMTGEKPEQILLTQARMSALSREIDFLETTSNFYELNAPISGNLRYESDLNGDRVIVEDTSEYIIFIPVRLKNRYFIKDNVAIELELVGRDTMINAELVEVSKQTSQLNNNVVVMVKACISGTEFGLSPGMPVACTVKCGEVRLLEYLKRSIKVDIR